MMTKRQLTRYWSMASYFLSLSQERKKCDGLKTGFWVSEEALVNNVNIFVEEKHSLRAV